MRLILACSMAIMLTSSVSTGNVALATELEAPFQEAVRTERWQDVVQLGKALLLTKQESSREWCEAQNDVGVAFMNLGRWEDAWARLGRVEKACGLDAKVAYNLGVAALFLERPLDALRYYGEAQRLGKSGPDVLIGLAEANRWLGRWVEALSLYRAFSAAEPYRPEGYRGEMLCLLELGKYQEAASLADWLGRMAPLKNFGRECRLGAAKAYARVGRFAQAQKLLSGLMEENPFDLSTILMEAELKLRQKDLVRARRLVEKALIMGADGSQMRDQLLGIVKNEEWKMFLDDIEVR